MGGATSSLVILMSPDGGQGVDGSDWPADSDLMLRYQRKLWGAEASLVMAIVVR